MHSGDAISFTFLKPCQFIHRTLTNLNKKQTKPLKISSVMQHNYPGRFHNVAARGPQALGAEHLASSFQKRTIDLEEKDTVVTTKPVNGENGGRYE